MKDTNLKENLAILEQNYSENDFCKLSDFIPEYFEKKLFVDKDEIDFNDIISNIDAKLERSWLYHQSFMKIVDIVSELGTCSRRKVGAVLVKDRRILATGFNGTPPGAPHCNDEICPGRNAPSGTSLSLCAAVHAEENCLLYCAKYGVAAGGSVLYCSCEPCDDCMKLVETVGITMVIFRNPYPTKMSALRKYFKAKSVSLSDLAESYKSFSNSRLEFPLV